MLIDSLAVVFRLRASVAISPHVRNWPTIREVWLGLSRVKRHKQSDGLPLAN